MKGLQMRKLIVLLVLVTIGFSVFPVSATSVDELTALARFFPVDTPIFAAVRTDDALIDELDSLAANVAAKLGTELPISLRDSLDVFAASSAIIASEAAGTDAETTEALPNFDTIFRSWLGDTAAVGILSLDILSGASTPIVAAFSVTDRANAEVFVDQSLATNSFQTFEKSTDEVSGSTLWQSTDFGTSDWVLFDDVLLITTDVPAPLGLTPIADTNLSTNEIFTETVGLLPAESYAALAYVDLGGIIQPFAALAPLLLPPDTPDIDVDGLINAIGAQAVGLTILEERAFVLDTVVQAGDSSALEALGLSTAGTAGQPVDPALAGFVPGDSIFAIQGTNFGPSITALLDAFAGLGKMLDEQDISLAAIDPNLDPRLSLILGGLNLDDPIVFLRQAFRGMVGLDLDADVLAWMSGNFATYLRAPQTATGKYTLDAGLVVEVTDTEAATQLMAAIPLFLEQINRSFIQQENAIILPAPEFDLPEELPFELPGNLIGMNEAIFTVATQAGGEFSLKPTDNSLANTPAWQGGQSFFLPDTSSVFFVNLPAIRDLAAGFVAVNPDAPFDTLSEEKQLVRILDLFESISFTAATDENNNAVSRFVVSLDL